MNTDSARRGKVLAVFVVIPATIVLALEATYRRVGLAGLGPFVTIAFGLAMLSVAVAALGSIVLAAFRPRPSPTPSSGVFAMLWLIAIFGTVLPSIYVIVLENRWVSRELPLLDSIAVGAARPGIGTAVPGLLDRAPEVARVAAQRAGLQRLQRTDGRVLAASGSSWSGSYRFNAASCCWEAWDEDVVINPYVRCVAP